MKLGIDLGSTNTKSSKGIIFTSKVTEFSMLEEEENKYFIDGKPYYLEEGNYDTEYRKIDKKNLITLLYLSIFKSTTDSINDIVVGLPPGQYKADRYLLKDKIMKENKKTIIHQGKEKELNIRKIEVLPEGILCTPADFEGILIDIGGRTTDIALIEIINGKKIINQATSKPIGIQNLYSDFIKEINNNHGLNLKDFEAERIIRKGLYIWGEKTDTAKELQIYNNFCNDLVTTLQLDFSLKTNDVLISGGGGKLLLNFLKKHIKNAELLPNSLFANAIIYGKYAERRL